MSEKKHFNLYGGKRELVIIKERKHSDVLKWQLLLSDYLVCVVLPSLSTSVLSVMVQLFVIKKRVMYTRTVTKQSETSSHQNRYSH